MCFSLPGLNAFIIIGAVLLSAGITFATNWLALIPWRRGRDKHWSEQARLVHPVVVAARANLWIVPCIFILTVVLLWPKSSPLWVFTGMAAILGAYAGTIPLDREVFPRILLRDSLRLSAVGLLLRFLIWLVFIGAAVFMPNQFNLLAWGIGLGVGCLWLIWLRGGFIWTGRKLGLILPATERLQSVAANTAAKMNVPFREILLLRVPVAQALAFPTTRRVMFTERLLEICPDDEVAAICAHELGHLTESKTARFSRSIVMMTFLPWIFFNPLTHVFGLLAFYGLLFATIATPVIFRKISHNLEARADKMAKANEGDAGTYARALTRLYADNLAPAVAAKNRASHPHLYDRLLAAGVTPDFPRPAAAASMALHGRIFAWIVGLLFAAFAFQLMNTYVNY